MAPRLSLVQRQTIIALYKADIKVIDIAKWTGITRKSIYMWLRRHAETGGDLSTQHRKNYKRATTSEQDNQIIQQHMYNPKQSTTATASQYDVSPRTIRRRLLDAGVKQKIVRKKPSKPRQPKQNKKQKKPQKEQEKTGTDSSWPYKCNVCGNVFPQRGELYNHNRLVHLGLNFFQTVEKRKKKLVEKKGAPRPPTPTLDMMLPPDLPSPPAEMPLQPTSIIPTSNMPMSTQNNMLQQSNMIHNQNMSMQAQSMSMQAQNMSMQPQNMSMQPQNISMQAQTMSIPPQNMSIQPQSMSMQAQNMSMQPQNMSLHQQSMTMQPTNLSMTSGCRYANEQCG